MPPKEKDASALGAAEVGPGPYRIQVAAELSGTPPATLRAWERRYGVPAPRRTTTAYRLYTADDVNLVRRMNELVVSGVAPSDAARMVLSSESPPSERRPDEVEHEPFMLAQQRLLAATLRWDSDAIDAELLRLSCLIDAPTMYARVVAPLLAEVGAAWERGELSVAQEHLLSVKVESALRAALRTMDRRDGPLALVTCVEGEEHVIGLLGAAIRLASGGWRVAVLGASTPPRALGEAVRSMMPRLVGLSLTRAPEEPEAFFRAYGAAIGRTPWVVGGPAAAAVAEAIVRAGGALVADGKTWSQQMRDWVRAPR